MLHKSTEFVGDFFKKIQSRKVDFQVIEKFPHIRNYKSFKVPKDLDIGDLVKSQLAVVCFDGNSFLYHFIYIFYVFIFVSLSCLG